MTETALISYTPGRRLEEIPELSSQSAMPANLGKCTKGVFVRIIGEHDKQLGDNETGHIQVLAPKRVFSGYYGEEDRLADIFTQDGWFKTGDLGFVKDGDLRIVGREKNIAIINARKISLEQVEAPLKNLDTIVQPLVASAAVQSYETGPDKLAVFFVPKQTSPSELNATCRQISRLVAEHSHVRVTYLVPLKAEEFPRTPNGKVKRTDLVDALRTGRLAAHQTYPSQSRENKPLTENEAADWLADLWQQILKLDRKPPLEENFFDLGGDSFAATELITAVEAHSGNLLPVDAFFKDPTILSLAKLLKSPPSTWAASTLENMPEILRRITTFVSSWRGERASPDSLIVGANTKGNRPPLFWVFQGENEFLQLAKSLGPDQPLYGMRSLHLIISPRDIVDLKVNDELNSVCQRYIAELRALVGERRFFLGSNCQAGLITLPMARRLAEKGSGPERLILMEWGFSFGSYAAPVTFLYGKESWTNTLFEGPVRDDLNWRADFPAHKVFSIPGQHGQFFSDDNVFELSQTLLKKALIKHNAPQS